MQNSTSTIREKGQTTIPKYIRDVLDLPEGQKLFWQIEKDKREVRVKAPEDFLEFAKKIRVKRKIDPVKARENMENEYERF